MFTLCQKRQFIYPNKVNSPPIRQSPSCSISGGVTCHVTIILWHKKTSRFRFGKKSFCSRYPSKRYCQSIENIFDPDLKPLSFSSPSPSLVWYSALSDAFWSFSCQRIANLAMFVSTRATNLTHQNGLLESVHYNKIWCLIINPLYLLFER